ncbi:patatin-like phospholipase family protein [Dermacoccus nishinomiyaensis]
MSEHTTTTLVPRAAVCGGGGVAGLAWMVGYLHGATVSGIPLRSADLVIGTSAGAVAATLLRSTGGLPTAFRRLSNEDDLPFEAPPPSAGFATAAPKILAETTNPGAYARAFLDLSLTVPATEPVMEARLGTLKERVGTTRWTAGDLRITTLSHRTAERRVLTRDSGVGLLTALAASCAVPGVWPAVPLPDGDLGVDAGPLSATHADLAQDAERVLVLRPVPNLQGDLAAETDVLERALIVEPTHPLEGPTDRDPRVTACLAGFAQALTQTDLLRSAWSTEATSTP